MRGEWKNLNALVQMMRSYFCNLTGDEFTELPPVPLSFANVRDEVIVRLEVELSLKVKKHIPRIGFK